MNETYIPLSDSERDYCEKTIAALVNQCKGLLGCVIASVDGFVVAEVNQQGDSGERLAAMSSSATALANAIVDELEYGQLNTLVIDASKGKILVLSILTDKQELALLCACNSEALIGQVLFSAKAAVGKIVSKLKN